MATAANTELNGFNAKLAPDILAETLALLAKAPAHLPGAVLPVYGNHNALATGFGTVIRSKTSFFACGDAVLGSALPSRRHQA